MSSRRFPSLTHCELCLNAGPLRESHIIPKFFGKQLKKESNSQTLVDGVNPEKNPRPQDITKARLLCSKCELRFSKWEAAFRNGIMPSNKSLLAPIEYGDWMLKFAVSISWRILTYIKYSPAYLDYQVSTPKGLMDLLKPVPEAAHIQAEAALNKWRSFLLNHQTTLPPHNQHFFMLNGKNFPHENCNALLFTTFADEEIVATHALMGQFIIMGIIVGDPLSWKGTLIDPSVGTIGLQQTISQSYAGWLAKLFSEIENVSVEDWARRNRTRAERVVGREPR